MPYLRSVLLLIATLGTNLLLYGHDTYNIRQISNRDGLSNSSVICLFQDTERNLWAGTYDGLNKYNGVDINIYKPDIRDEYSISGNVIRRIAESKDDYLWIVTKGGLNKYSKKRDRVEACFTEFPENSAMAADSRGDFYVMQPNGHCSWFDFDNNRFSRIDVPDFNPKSGWVSMIIDTDDKVWVTNNGVIRQYAIVSGEDGAPGLELLGNMPHKSHIVFIFQDRGTISFVDGAGDLFIYREGEKTFIGNIRQQMREYGEISTIVMDGDDVMIGFGTSGLVKLDSSDGYSANRFPINCGVFSLYKDDAQDILWVGTDGQGIYACVKDEYVFRGINLDELPVKTERPVRAIYRDDSGNLWLGTKGNGIIKVKDYANATEFDNENVRHFTTRDGLSNDAVFRFEMSRAHNVLWIGSSGPRLNYYSFYDDSIHTLRSERNIPFVEVHSILETSDSTLWVSSLFSLLKVDIRKTGNTLTARNVRRYEFDIQNKHLFNKIYAIQQESDSIMWLAMRGNGAIRFNSVTGGYTLVTMDEENSIAPMNDILSIHINKKKEIWLGASYGINKLTPLPDGGFECRNYNENDGLANNTIHGILESDTGELWFSSNTGITLFDPVKKTSRNFNQHSGLKVVEFSDNAYYKDGATSKYFFGGIDGVVCIEHGVKKRDHFVPPVYFTKLRIFNEEVNIDDFLTHKRGKERLQLRHDQNFFSVLFSTNDYIDGASIKFAYMLGNFNSVWMNTNSREAQFTNIPPGDYELQVRYGNEYGTDSDIAVLNIRILPPWYLSTYARLFYLFASLGLLLIVFILFTRKYDRKREMMARQLDQKYKEEMYENKLRFFTNITHEFCTPLTLIHTPSERILSHEGSDEFVKKYARIIKSNTERLNTLIQEIIDFRRMETGNKVCRIETCDVSGICTEIVESFADLAEENHIDFRLDSEPGLQWNTDPSFISRILNNLISNAFKYTPAHGTINISAAIINGEFVLKVYNSGKGIREEDIPYIFNRYSVLDNIKENSIKGLSSRNGLGLAICKSMADLLGGQIDIRSKVGEYAEFIVTLPHRDPDKAETAPPVPASIPEEGTTEEPEAVHSDDDTPARTVRNEQWEETARQTDGRSTILIVDDNEEILDVLKDILAEEYTIMTARDGIEGYRQLTETMPDLVMTDIMMPNQDGFLMTRQIKVNPHTMHIPVVIVSAKSAIDDKIEGVESGADAYISKPFDTKYLRTVVRHLIEKHKKLRDYYNSAASSFDYMNGQLLMKEDRAFIQQAISMVEQNIGHIEFSPEDLADNLGVSLRSLYRRFKDLGLLPPKDFIKKQRIEYSAKLLSSTNLTIQEIMYSAGFTTRSHFYKEFTKRYNQSPREYREQREAQWEEQKKKGE